MGTQLPSPKKGTEPPVLGPFLVWPNDWMHQDMPLGMEVGLSPGNFVRWGPSPPSQKGVGAPPPRFFLTHVCCGQTAACIKMPLGMEVALGTGDFVLDGDPAPPAQKGGGAPIFSAHV